MALLSKEGIEMNSGCCLKQGQSSGGISGTPHPYRGIMIIV